jgi:hypothetical protein
MELFKREQAMSMSVDSTVLLSLSLACAVARRIMVSRVRTVMGTETFDWSVLMALVRRAE